jgi:hypothetical protein
MTGLYSPINRLMEQVTRPKGTGAEYMAELQKKPGYKPAEAEDRDLQALMALPQMARAEFMEKLKAQANKFPLKQRELTGSQTHHEDYTLPGGENYREILLHTPMPKGEGFPGVGHHFGGTPNILASVRVKDRVGPEQMGYTLQNEKSGFKGPHFKTVEEAKAARENYPEHLRPMLQLAYSRAPGKKILHIEEIQSDWHQQGREKGYAKPGEESEGKVPYGPHAKDWHELALKAMIQHAAENGYDQIAVTPGAEQARRYGLSSMIDELHYFPEEKKLTGYLGKGKLRVLNKGNVLPEELPQYVGKEVTKNLLQQPVGLSGSHVIKGKELEVGGEGMKGFYDKMVPTFLNKFGKKHGVQVNTSTSAEVMADTPTFNPDTGKDVYHDVPLHTFDITPAMREDVLKNGIPRYAEGGDVSRGTADANKAKFLKGSKVPERVYHGTGNLENLQSFDPAMTGKGTDQLGSGFYFSNKPETASGYATSVTQNAAPGTPKLGGNNSPGMVAAHLAIKKPIRIGPKGNNLNDSNVKLTHDQVKRIIAHAPDLHNPDESPLANHFDLSKGVTPKMIHNVAQYYTGPQTLHMLENDMFPNNPTEYRHALHNVLGYDGVVKDFGNGEKHYVAWFPHQIKSAIGNRGTYDTSNPDITKAAGGVVKEKVTISPNMDVMQYELINRKAK